MVDDQLLLSLLQFVALVAPAIALLMQYFHTSESAGKEVFGILEGAMTMMILGGLIIGYQIFIQINNFAVSAGIFFIIASLLFIALAIWWRYLPVSIEPSEFTIRNLGKFIKRGVAVSVLILLPILIFWFPFDYSQNFLDAHLNYGIIRDNPDLSPSMFFGGVTLLLIARMMLYHIRAGTLAEEDVSDAFTDTLSTALALLILILLLIIPPFGLASLLLGVSFDLGPFSEPGNVVYSLPYFWTAMVVLIFFLIKLEAEEEGDHNAETEPTSGQDDDQGDLSEF